MAVALFDLDRTLIDCNSGRLWLTHEVKAGRVRIRDAIWASYWLVRYSLGSADLEHVFETAVASLEGQDEAELADRTMAWFDAHVAQRLRPGAREALDAHRQTGDRLVLATSSSLYAGRAAVERFGLDDLICSRFEVVDGRFTGQVAELALAEHKAERAEEYAAREGIDLDEATFYTDSYTDRALLERVGRPVAVHPDPP